MKDLTVIVPLHEYNDNVDAFLKGALYSFKKADKDKNSEVLFVGPQKIMDEISEKYKEKRYRFLVNEESDFCTQINKAVEDCKKYFSILEYDDTYTETWFDNVEKYIKDTNDTVSIYLPLTEIIIDRKQKDGPIGYVNEAVWAQSFSDTLGYLDLESLLNYMNFNTTGAVFKTEDFKEVGGLKAPIKLTFWYEFLLRAVRNDKKVFTIPKVGYQHLLDREGSLSSTYNKTLTPEEADFWLDLAKKDYFFKKLRDLSHYQWEK